MYSEKDLVRVAKRENNNKRSYLVVNCLQAKHVPVEPGKAIEMFDELSELLKEQYKDEKVLIVGFAETATAIGARLAVQLNSMYMQTTRESIENVEYLFFTESHSHATEQKLIKNDLDEVIGDIDRIIFAEDEVTTGNTIMKIINIIKNMYHEKVVFSVASILNGMDEHAIDVYKNADINLHYLVKTDHAPYSDIVEKYKCDGDCVVDYVPVENPMMEKYDVNGYVNGRRLTKGEMYENACEYLWKKILEKESFDEKESVLVIGTEEFMYPAIYIASQIEKIGCKTKCHSTTRSPIAVSSEVNYPLHCRYALRSMYDENRKTFIYDIDKYDIVYIITDAQEVSNAGLNDLYSALMKNGNNNIKLIRWCK